MTIYAANTDVPVDRSQLQIKRELQRYGADSFMFCEEPARAMIQFRYQGRSVRFIIEFPDRNSPRFTKSAKQKRPRDEAFAFRAWEQACRQKWRALHLFVKAALEAAHGGIVTFDDVFLPFLVLPNDRTVGEHLRPMIDKAVKQGLMPRLQIGAPEPAAGALSKEATES